MRKKTLFFGLSTAIVTPFKEDGRIDFDAFSRLIDFQLEGGASALTVCGTTGEASTLSDKERSKLISFTRKMVGEKIPIIAGSGSNCTFNAIKLSREAEEAGADALLCVTPYYNKANSEGLFEYFSAIADSVSLPIILYNVPSRTGVRIPFEVYKRLSENEKIVGVKDAGGNISESISLISSLSDKLDIYCGEDSFLFPMLSLGCKGCISAAGNIIPSELSSVCSLYFDGKVEESRALFFSLLPLLDSLYSDINPIMMKHALSFMSLCSDRMRAPLCSAEDEKKEKLFSLLDK